MRTKPTVAPFGSWESPITAELIASEAMRVSDITLVGEAVMMVSGGLTLKQVGGAIHPHPTQTELFGDLARRLHSRLQRSKKRAKA